MSSAKQTVIYYISFFHLRTKRIKILLGTALRSTLETAFLETSFDEEASLRLVALIPVLPG